MPVTHYRWDRLSDNVLMEVDQTGATTVQYTIEPNQFGKLISQRRNGVDSYHHFDAQLSTRQLTDASQTVTDSYDYTAYGETVATSGTTENPFRFQGAVGYYTNDETDDVYIRRRTYRPSTGRWLSADPLGFVDGPNVYLGYFVPGGFDPSGSLKMIPREPRFKDCGGITHSVSWDTEKGEGSGIILQKVCSEFEIGDCANGKPPNCGKGFDGENTRICPEMGGDDGDPLTYKTCYLEIWWVGLVKGVIAGDKRRPGRRGATDTFFFPNCKNSQGLFVQSGEALFLSNDWLKENGFEDVVNNDFEGPPEGVRNAGILWSACFSDDGPRKLWEKAANPFERTILNRRVEDAWDCCDGRETACWQDAQPRPERRKKE